MSHSLTVLHVHLWFYLLFALSEACCACSVFTIFSLILSGFGFLQVLIFAPSRLTAHLLLLVRVLWPTNPLLQCILLLLQCVSLFDYACIKAAFIPGFSQPFRCFNTHRLLSAYLTQCTVFTQMPKVCQSLSVNLLNPFKVVTFFYRSIRTKLQLLN